MKQRPPTNSRQSCL